MIELIIGILGMLLILIAFILSEVELVARHIVLYNFLNVVGSILLAYYAYILNSLPFLILNITWIAFATYKLLTIIER